MLVNFFKPFNSFDVGVSTNVHVGHQIYLFSVETPLDILTIFLITFISFLSLYFLIRMAKILNHPKIWIISSVVTIIIIYFCFVFYSANETGKFTLADFFNVSVYILPSISFLSFLIWFVLIIFYEFKVEENQNVEEYSNMITLLVAIAVIILGITLPSLSKEYFSNAIDFDRMNDSVKSGIFIYDNKIGHENITLIICNNGNRYYDKNIRLSVGFKNERGLTYDVSERIIEITSRGIVWDATGEKTPELSNRTNFTVFKFEGLGNKIDEEPNYIYVNLSVDWNSNESYVEPTKYTFSMGKYPFSTGEIRIKTSIIPKKPKINRLPSI